MIDTYNDGKSHMVTVLVIAETWQHTAAIMTLVRKTNWNRSVVYVSRFSETHINERIFSLYLTYTLHLCCVVFDEMVITTSCREAHWVRTYAACFIFMLKVKNQSAELDATIPASAATRIVWSVAGESCMGPAVVGMMFNRLAHTLGVSCFMFFF